MANNSTRLANAFLDFYHGLLGSEGVVRKVENAIIAKGNILDEAQHQALSLDFSAKDIKNAIFSILDEKSPGLDGYSSCFCKKTWDIVGRDVVAAV